MTTEKLGASCGPGAGQKYQGPADLAVSSLVYKKTIIE